MPYGNVSHSYTKISGDVPPRIAVARSSNRLSDVVGIYSIEASYVSSKSASSAERSGESFVGLRS